MAANAIHAILFVLDIGLGGMHIAEFIMGSHHHPKVDHNRVTLRIFAGLNTEDLVDANGTWPDIRVYNERGIFRGARCAEMVWDGEKSANRHLPSGDWADIKVGMGESEGQPTYALLSGNQDALCIAYVTMTRPDGGKGSILAGNWARACDTRQHNISTFQTYPDNPTEIPWYYSNVVIDDNKDPLMCVWLGQGGDVSTTGMSVHFQDFAASTPHKGEEGIQFYCEGNPSLKFYTENPSQKALVWEPEPYTPEPVPTPGFDFGDVAFNPNVSQTYWEAVQQGQAITYNGSQEENEVDQDEKKVDQDENEVDQEENKVDQEENEVDQEEGYSLTKKSSSGGGNSDAGNVSIPDMLYGSLRRWLKGRHEEEHEGDHDEHGHPLKSPPTPEQPLHPKMRRPSFVTKRAEKCEWKGFKTNIMSGGWGPGQHSGNIFGSIAPVHPDPNLNEYLLLGRPHRRHRQQDEAAAEAAKGHPSSPTAAPVTPAPDTRIVFSNSTTQTATALCVGGSKGPKFVSWAEGKYCNPRTNEVLPLCGSDGAKEDCFDAELAELRVRRSLAKRGLLSDGHMQDDEMDHHLLLQWLEPGKEATKLLRPNRAKRDAGAERKRAVILERRGINFG